MDRRRYLQAVAGATTFSIAGCAAPGNEGGEGTPAEKEGTPTETPGGQTPAENATPTGTPGGAQVPNTIQMVTEGSNYFFNPIGLYVEPGETITWRIKSGSHSSTAYKEGNGPAKVTRIPSGAKAWDSGVLSEQGATFEHTFETTGTYDYFCIPHKTLGMVGRLVVGEPGGPAAGSQPPDGSVPNSDAIVQKKAIGYDEFTG